LCRGELIICCVRCRVQVGMIQLLHRVEGFFENHFLSLHFWRFNLNLSGSNYRLGEWGCSFIILGRFLGFTAISIGKCATETSIGQARWTHLLLGLLQWLLNSSGLGIFFGNLCFGWGWWRDIIARVIFAVDYPPLFLVAVVHCGGGFPRKSLLLSWEQWHERTENSVNTTSLLGLLLSWLYWLSLDRLLDWLFGFLNRLGYRLNNFRLLLRDDYRRSYCKDWLGFNHLLWLLLLNLVIDGLFLNRFGKSRSNLRPRLSLGL